MHIVYSFDLPQKWIFGNNTKTLFENNILGNESLKYHFESLYNWLIKFKNYWKVDTYVLFPGDSEAVLLQPSVIIERNVLLVKLQLKLHFLDEQLACIFKLNVTPEMNFDHL